MEADKKIAIEQAIAIVFKLSPNENRELIHKIHATAIHITLRWIAIHGNATGTIALRIHILRHSGIHRTRAVATQIRAQALY